MNAAHLHLLLNHVPVIGVAFCLLLALYAFMRRSRELEATALWAFVLVAVLTVPVYLTGEPAEEIAESLPGVSEAVIEPHEESALLALAAVEVLGLLALAMLMAGRLGGGRPRWMFVMVLVLAFVASGMMARTANLGGQIRHTEIRSAR